VLFSERKSRRGGKKMKTTIVKGASILTVMLFFSMVLTPVFGGEVQPFNRWGYAFEDVGETIPLDTQLITSWVEGVSYGSDVTGTGGDVGLFDIDTLGDTTDSPAVKTGGWNGDEVWYVHGELTTANPGTFFAESDAWLVGGYNIPAANLHYAGTQPPLLKINNVSTDSGLAAANDYVVVYNPTAAAVDILDYSFSIGVGAPIAIGPGNIIAGLYAWNVNPIPAGGFLALDMGALDLAGDALLLSHNPTGFIIERVEYGTPTPEIDDSQPGPANDNAANPAVGQEIYRTGGPGVDTNVHNVDFATQIVWLPERVLTRIEVVPVETVQPEDWIGTVGMTATGFDQVGGTMAIAPAWASTDATVWFTGVTPGDPATATLNADGSQVAGNYLITATDVVVGTAFLNWTPIGAGVTPWDIACHKAGNDILIDWTTGVGPWDVYYASSADDSAVRGTQPFVLLAGGVAAPTYTHVGALLNTDSYAYYVTADGGVTKSNLGFKLTRPLAANSLAYNWIGLPYKTDLIDADSIMDDINLDAGVDDTCDIATWWDTSVMGYIDRTDLGGIRVGINWAATPGVGYQVHVVAPVDWMIVGANQDKDAAYNIIPITVPLVDTGLAYNWIAFPYNTQFANADAVMDQINTDTAGAPANDCIDILTWWDESVMGYIDRTDLGGIRVGINFIIDPGHGYQAHMIAGFGNPTWDISQNTLEP
jgi:hypothetical protein